MIRALLLERFSAQLLEANWALKGALVPHLGKSVLLAIGTQPPLCWEILDTYFRVIPAPEVTDLTIRGDTVALVHAWFRQRAQEPLIGSGLWLEGDMELAEALQRGMQASDIDFEAFFSPWVAPIAGPLLRWGVNYVAQHGPTWAQHVQVYLQEEKALLPTVTRFSEFREGVIACRQAAERLEARLENLSPMK